MYLGWIDYTVLALLLSFSTIIGIYHGCIRSKQLSAKEFLVADGRMGIIPTAMSLMASIRSAATLLGTPVDIYYYGTMYFYYIISWLIATYLASKLFIPKFHQIGNISIYAYLEQRFSLAVRIVVTCNFIFATILYLGVVLYGPSLALSQVTGLNIWLACGSCGIVCTIYTSIGGMKAVIWTDVIQATMMFIGIIISIVFGLIDAGGITKVFNTLAAGDRLQITTVTLNPATRYTTWSILIGGSLSSTALCACLQTQAQRYMCVKDVKSAKRTAWLNAFMSIVMILLCISVGCLLYAKYSQCDPLRAKLITKSDQLYPLFVIQTFSHIPGFTGLFIACILSASLSTISSGVNSLATVIIEDIYKRLSFTKKLSNKSQAIVSKVLSVGIGLLIILLAFMVSYLKSNILTIVLQIFGAFATPILGVYLLGFFVPRVKSRSVIVAFLLCLMFQLFILVEYNLTGPLHRKPDGRLPTSVNGCTSGVNISLPIIKSTSPNRLVALFSISPLWYGFNGVFITMFLAIIFSFICDSKDPKKVDRSLLIPFTELFPCYSSEKPKLEPTEIKNDNEINERESML